VQLAGVDNLEEMQEDEDFVNELMHSKELDQSDSERSVEAGGKEAEDAARASLNESVTPKPTLEIPPISTVNVSPISSSSMPSVPIIAPSTQQEDNDEEDFIVVENEIDS
jgi:hypothetical protein